MIVTSADVGLALHCKYDLQNQTVTNNLLSGLEVKGALDTAEFFEETIVDSPNVVMRVTDPEGQDIISAKVMHSQVYLISYIFFSSRLRHRVQDDKILCVPEHTFHSR